MKLDPVALTQKLIRFPSETPTRGEVFDFVESLLCELGFFCERIPHQRGAEKERVDNLYARYGDKEPVIAFAGHLDVVPAGKKEKWIYPAFSGEIKDRKIYGRGAVDMKSGVACFIAAIAEYLSVLLDKGSIIILLSGDEEASNCYGMQAILDKKADEVRLCHLCVMGEPTSVAQTGDMIKIGRRGSLTAKVHFLGKEGHSAYPDKADNSAHLLVKGLSRLAEGAIDKGSEHFSPSLLQIVSLDTESHVFNVIPGKATALINIRYNDQHNAESLYGFIAKKIGNAIPKTQWEWELIGDSKPFITDPSATSRYLQEACEKVTGITPAFSTKGGTSDSQFITHYCPVVDFGLPGASMHQYNESVSIGEIERLSEVYLEFMQIFFSRTA